MDVCAAVDLPCRTGVCAAILPAVLAAGGAAVAGCVLAGGSTIGPLSVCGVRMAPALEKLPCTETRGGIAMALAGCAGCTREETTHPPPITTAAIAAAAAMRARELCIQALFSLNATGH